MKKQTNKQTNKKQRNDSYSWLVKTCEKCTRKCVIRILENLKILEKSTGRDMTLPHQAIRFTHL